MEYSKIKAKLKKIGKTTLGWIVKIFLILLTIVCMRGCMRLGKLVLGGL